METRKKKKFAFLNIRFILKILLILTIVAGLAVGAYFILRACGFTTKSDFERLRSEMGESIWFWLTVGSLQVFQVIFIPISNQLVTGSLALIFPVSQLWKVFLVSWISIWIATLILYFLGRWGGEKVLRWLLKDEEGVKKSTNFLNRGWIFYPLGCLAPIVPDDVITVLAGTAKMNFIFIVVSSLITRAIDIACSVWGFGIIGKKWWGWLLLGIGYALLIVASIIIFKKQNKKDIAETTEQ